MKTFLVLMMLVMTVLAYGETFSESGLNEEEVNKLKKFYAEMKLSAPKQEVSSITKAEEISQWINIGEQLGKGLASCAKELGIEVNNFVQTPVGKISAVVIIWKLLGRDLVHFGFGTFFFIFGSILWIYFYKKMCIIESIKLGDSGKLWGYSSKEIKYHEQGSVDGTRVVMMFVALAITCTSLLVIFT